MSMRSPCFEDTFDLLAEYIVRRPRRGPFPLESAFTWSILLNAQSANSIRGDMLEIGVEFGTSAFLLLDALHKKEHLTLVDLIKTREWIEGCSGPYSDRTNFTFLEGNSHKLDPNLLPTGCRWIHVDGGHLYDHVLKDLQLTAHRLSDDGILVLDDFFEIRWPDVTTAFVDFMRTEPGLQPFLLVNRKVYCVRSAETAATYRHLFEGFVRENANRIGTVKAWDKVAFLGRELLVAKMDLSEDIMALEKPQQDQGSR